MSDLRLSGAVLCGSDKRRYGRQFGAAVAALSLVALALLSILVGGRGISLATVVNAFFSYDPLSLEHVIIREYRLPRTLLALLCGAGFGVSGALFQAVSRNPLADPGVLGVNAGAAFFVTLAVGLFGWHSINAYIWASFAGAILATSAVYVLGASRRDGATPVRLVLAGVAISAILGGIGSSMTFLNPQAFDAMRMWHVGSVAGRDISVVGTVAPFIAAGLCLALIAARSLNVVALGEDLAKSLGSSILSARLVAIVAITLLAGASTAAAGPIAFVGLMVPHAVRWFTGPDQRWIIGLTMICAPLLLLAADIAGRLVLYPGELETGIVTAFIGGPVLILLVRRMKVSGL